ncbi:MAG TPA: DnaJ domain-containing protein, partial [Phenylobacterium sp.]|nr:DnaJ domain-containing protein [Phenylobacterium sp.]
PARSAGAMSLAEARALLGVEEGASPEDIRAAYNRLIRRTHPDAGGTAGLAAQLNAARDRLLKS